ncbi:MAG: nucleotide sugar dehydrogenase [Euryarchaeota archaeon]|nr:nucleotide sugar dehydrogenase [Euryarchaeota archaeon]
MEIFERLEDRSAVVCVVGVGYVGQPLAEAFSKHLKVIGYDMNGSKIEELNNKNNNNNLIFTSDPAEINKADFVLIAVPTPITESKEPDLFCVRSSVDTVGRNLKKGSVVVLESTVYPGVTEEIAMSVLDKSSGMKCGVDFKVGYSPERINPGDEVHGISNITKIVSGMDEETTEVLAKLYNLITTVFKAKDIRTAEAAKVIENIQRDLNIALMNELALIFERMNIDIMDVIEAAATKWNFNVYYPGAGVGGHCLPVDPYYLVKKAEELGYHSKVITAGRAVNDYMPMHVFKLLVDALNECERAVKGSKVVVLGFSYKENVGDARESPVEVFVEELKKKGAHVCIIDPYFKDGYLDRYGEVETDVYKAIEGADAIVLMTGHREFREIDLWCVKEGMRTAILIDGRRMFDRDVVSGVGFVYRGVGAE